MYAILQCVNPGGLGLWVVGCLFIACGARWRSVLSGVVSMRRGGVGRDVVGWAW